MNSCPAPSRPRTSGPETSRPRRASVAAGAVALAIVLAACSSSEAAAPTAASASPSAAAEQDAAPSDGVRPQGGAGAPGVSGELAAVDGSTGQVQDAESQTAVSWSDSTTITVTETGSLGDLTVGSCVVARSGGMPGADSDDDAAGSTAASTAASSVAVSDPVEGECTGGLAGGFAGGRPGGGGMPTDLPEPPAGTSTDRPSGAPRDGGSGGFGGTTAGTVLAVDGTQVSVSTTSGDGTTAEQVLTVDDATTYTVQRAGTSADVVVGQCVTVVGDSDDSGALTATTLSVSAPGDDGCSAGFGAGRGGRGAGGDGDA